MKTLTKDSEAEEQKSLQEQLFDDIKRRVITCELAPGSDISENSLATEYAVTKAPVRSALMRLKEAGWLQSVPRKGHVVMPLSYKDIDEVFDARELIEPQTARLAAGHVSKSYLTALNHACTVEYDLDDVEGKRKFLLANAAFHIGIGQACGNSILSTMLAQLHEKSLRILYFSVNSANRSKSWRTGHDSMIAMLLEGDAEGAYQETLEGIRRSRKSVMESIMKKTVPIIST